MKTSIFGTDGIRGAFGAAPLDHGTVFELGRQLVGLIGETGLETPSIVVGGDTRESTPLLTDWFAEGVVHAGGTVKRAGVVPTPAVARVVASSAHAGGVVISASHNPWPDNGLKFFDADGFKWSVERERALEERLQPVSTPPPSGDPPSGVDPALAGRYVASLIESTRALAGSAKPLEGLRVVLDLGHGAASPLAAPVFADLGASTWVINDRPDGRNLNQGCGSTHPEVVAAAVLEQGADLGVSFDGDADRLIVCDHNGTVRDGDAIMYMWALALHRAGELTGNRIVATVMSNLGLHKALEAHGIDVVSCDVGDRAVVETLRNQGLRLGGEQSGHLIDLEHSTTGDGLLAALHLAARISSSGESLARHLEDFEVFPQLLRNVPVRSKPPFAEIDSLQEVIKAVETELGNEGRLLLRYSGTERLARIMVEGPDPDRIATLADRIADQLASEIGAPP